MVTLAGLITTLIISLVDCCNTPVKGINPTSSVNSAGGDNNTVTSESWYNSVKTVATINLSGGAGALIVFSIVFLLLIAVYKKLSDFLHLINGRVHNLAALFGIQGFAYTQPAITDSTSSRENKVQPPQNHH